MRYKFLMILSLALMFSCTEPIKIEPQEGPQMVGVFGSITNEYKKHTVELSRTRDFYSTSAPEMISNAEVFVSDGVDTIYYEETENAGIYRTVEDVAGVPGRNYKLMVSFADDNGEHQYYANSVMPQCVEQIDSIAIKDYVFGSLHADDVLGVYPYYQTLPDPNIYYMCHLYINGRLLTDTLTEAYYYSMMGFSGMYFNGELMTLLAGEFPVYSLDQSRPDSTEYLHDGDEVTLRLYCIPEGFALYISDILSNSGTNPMMGLPYNVTTNIMPENMAVGYFYAASMTEKSVIYHPENDDDSP
ncbi:MAG TPA: DUF4249 family protein [Bacteroidetes bacterium]|nr:DUF4249 family protein [Candidatus Limimorpha avicola]